MLKGCFRTVLLAGLFMIGIPRSGSAEKLLFHIKTSLSEDDAQICVAPNVALAGLENGDEVVILFDGSAVTSITQGWGWFVFGTTTPMDKAAMPERERESLSQQFKIPLKDIPHNYGDYLKFVKQRGTKVYVNRTMLTLYNIDPQKTDSVAQPVDLNAMLQLFKDADRVLVY